MTQARWRNTFLAEQVNRHGWTRGAELGVWKGATFLHLLKHCPGLHLIGVDLWAPQPGHTGPEDWTDWDHASHERTVRQGALSYSDRACIIKDTTVNAAKQVPDASLDFVFIDADHSTEGVLTDIDVWGPKLKPTGWFFGHDIDWSSVRTAVDQRLPGYKVGPNVVWVRPKNVTSDWGI